MSVRLTSKPPARAYSDDEKPQRPSCSRAVSGPRSQRNRTSSGAGKSVTQRNRNSRTKEAIRCYESDGIGHFARGCPMQRKREANPSNPPGKRNPTERSRHSGSPSGRTPPASNRSSRMKLEIRETGKRCERRQLPPPQDPWKCSHGALPFDFLGARYSLHCGWHWRSNSTLDFGHRTQHQDYAARHIENWRESQPWNPPEWLGKPSTSGASRLFHSQ
jgi:hypothetical protein